MATIKIKGGQSTNLPESLQERELAVTLDTGKLYVGTGNGKLLLNPDTENAVISVAGKTGAVTLTKTDVGLGNVDNTADSAKSVASAAKLTTARTIALSGAATGTATSFNGTANITIPVTSIDGTKVSGKVPTAVSADGAETAGRADAAITAEHAGEATTATKLATARGISITGGATAAAKNFDGTAAIALNVTGLDASKLSGTIDGGTF